MDLIKLTVKKPIDSFVILRAKWESEEFEIILFKENDLVISNVQQYIGKLDKVLLSEIANELEITENELLKETKSIFENPENTLKFTFELELDKETFIWRKNIDNDLKLMYGRLNLTSTSNLLIDFLVNSMENIKVLKEKNESLTLSEERCRKISNETRAIYDKYVSEQEKREVNNLTKYVALLNEKKNRILELEAMISRFDSNASGYETSSQEMCTEKCSKFDQEQSSHLLPKRVRTEQVPDPVASTSFDDKTEDQNWSQDSTYLKDTQELCENVFK